MLKKIHTLPTPRAHTHAIFQYVSNRDIVYSARWRQTTSSSSKIDYQGFFFKEKKCIKHVKNS